MKKIRLSDGNEIPCMGFGCFNGFGDEIAKAVEIAVRCGYPYVDSAANYRNEPEVGRGLAAAGDDSVYVLTKIWPTYFDDPEVSFDRSRRDLGREVLDACLLHWPGTKDDRRLHAWETLLKLKEQGKVRSIGVSNFHPWQMEQIKTEFGTYPAIDQIECHPTFREAERIAWCRERGITTVAYSPLNRVDDLENDTVRSIAAAHGRSAAQVVIRWHLQHDQIPIPKSTHEERIRANLDVFDFELTPEEMAAIDGLESGRQRGNDPDKFPEGC